MELAAPTPAISKPSLWAGRIISALVVLFLLFDGVTKVLKVAAVLEASAELGVRESVVPGIGIVLLVCTVVYAIPRTAVLGAILLTGYLGGATATHVLAGGPVFPVVFAVGFGVLVWLGLFLRDERLRTLVPLRSD
jgi:DoxX-like family